MRFSLRSSLGTGVSAYGEALARARDRGNLLDLTISNPTVCGFAYRQQALLQPLADPAALHYSADPRGMLSAREAVAALYRDAYGANTSPEAILLTASTSEAYGYLLRLLCDPGDAILVPSPSYPLFDLLARMHDVELIPYTLVYHDGWQLDPASLHAAFTPRVRALVTIHPNNPTGHMCSAADRAALYAAAAEHAVPIIADEVFLDYPVEIAAGRSFAAGNSPVLTFVLGGLSKLLALPQMKLAWTVVCGPEKSRNDALERLEIIADTFLSVATPVQLALPRWLGLRHQLQAEVRERIQANLAAVDSLLARPRSVLSRLRVEAGWSVVLRVPATDSDVDLAVRLLDEHQLALHPGSFYGFPPRGWLVAQLIGPTETLVRGIDRLERIWQESSE